MDYRTNGVVHILSLDKDEMITMIGLLYDGLERARMKDTEHDPVARIKYLNGETLVRNFKKLVLSSNPEEGSIS